MTLLAISWDGFLPKAAVDCHSTGGQVKLVGRRGVKQNLGFNESGAACSAKMPKHEEAKSPETGV